MNRDEFHSESRPRRLDVHELIFTKPLSQYFATQKKKKKITPFHKLRTNLLSRRMFRLISSTRLLRSLWFTVFPFYLFFYTSTSTSTYIKSFTRSCLFKPRARTAYSHKRRFEIIQNRSPTKSANRIGELDTRMAFYSYYYYNRNVNI